MLIAKLLGTIVVTAMFVWLGIKIYRSPATNRDYKGSREAKVIGTILALVGLIIWGVAVQTVWSAINLFDVFCVVFVAGVISMISWLQYKHA